LRVTLGAGQDLEEAIARCEAIAAQVSIRDWRWVLGPTAAATPFQLERLARLGIIVTVVPGLRFMTLGVHGPGAISGAPLRIRECLDAGVAVALGTAGVAPSMLWTMWALLEEAHEDAGRGLSREDVLRLAVQGGHRLTWSESHRGSLEPGKD